MPVIEPVVSAEKLRLLLDEEHESAALDYKSACDLSETRDLVELAKDIGAMQVDGGFLVVGADDHGKVTGQLSVAEAKLFDEARLRAKLDRYIPEPYELRSAVHEIEGSKVAIVYVGPKAKGWCIFRRDGTYLDRDGREVTVFRRGEVFARHGSASERWVQGDIDRIMARLIAREREVWREGLAADYRHIVAGSTAQDLATGPAAALSWQVDEGTFVDTVVEQLRRGDDIPLRLFLPRAVGDAGLILEQAGGEAELGILLDRLSCLTATLLLIKRREEFDEVVATLLQIYDLVFDEAGVPRRSASLPPARVWLMVIERIFALGALAVRRSEWATVRHLALQRGRGEDFTNPRYAYNSWLRHGLTEAARGNLLLEQQENRTVQLSLLSLALGHIRRESCLRPDLTETDERLLNSLCQFDALAALAAIADAKSLDTVVFYTNFARFHGRRTEPALASLIETPAMRQEIFPLDDDSLAAALRRLDDMASKEGFQYSGWHGTFDERIRQFLAAHPVEQPPDHA